MSSLEVPNNKSADGAPTEEAFCRALVANARESVQVLDRDLTVRFQNRSASELLGGDLRETEGTRLSDYLHPEDAELLAEVVASLVDTEGVSNPLQLRFRQGEGWRHVEVALRDMSRDPHVRGLLMTARDISDRRRLEDQLRQSQKMEAVGRLAGGIAHDFNNLLMAIQGNLTFAMQDVEEESDVREDLEEVLRASERAADLTRQLLSFSRRNVLEARVVDLSEVVERLQPMLVRLLPGNVQLRTRLSAGLWPVRVDPSQMEQVIMNLVVNAQDAMPRGGTLSIETRNIELGPEYGALRGVDARGPHVLLAVTDTGIGMSPQVQERAFEPFFTTKEDKGTGFGLSTVYGIVKQSGGSAALYSEEGYGTTVKIYLPRVAATEKVEPLEEPGAGQAPEGGRETILVAEDEDAVRRIVTRMVERQGYRVLAATSGTEALRLAQRHDGPLDLLLTDVVMPDVAGPELAEALSMMRPELKVLFMSGYTESSMIDRGAIADDHGFLDKPFTADALARTIRQVLDTPRIY